MRGRTLMPSPNPGLVSTLQKVGFRGEGLKTAYGIAMRESGGRPEAYNPDRSTGDDSYGLFQINMLGNMGPARRRAFGIQSNKQLLDPLINARAAYKLSKGGTDFGAWGIGPNAYRSGAGYDTIAKFLSSFPSITLKANQDPAVARTAAIAAQNTVLTTKNPISPAEVGSYNSNVAQLDANQKQIAEETRAQIAQLHRVNQAIQDSAVSNTTQSLLQRMGGTSAKVASTVSQPLTLPDYDKVIFQPQMPTPEKEYAVKEATGGSLIPPISSRTGNVPGLRDPNVPKQIQRVLAVAHEQIGKPYVWGAENPKQGFDCSGLIDYAYEQAGIPTPGRLTTYTMAKLGKSVKGQKYLPGDWILTNKGEHVVMYVGKNKVIAAPHTGELVQYQDLSRFKGDIVDVRRFR
jgi:cell wall-associated NlpC family hydrolase